MEHSTTEMLLYIMSVFIVGRSIEAPYSAFQAVSSPSPWMLYLPETSTCFQESSPNWSYGKSISAVESKLNSALQPNYSKPLGLQRLGCKMNNGYQGLENYCHNLSDTSSSSATPYQTVNWAVAKPDEEFGADFFSTLWKCHGPLSYHAGRPESIWSCTWRHIKLSVPSPHMPALEQCSNYFCFTRMLSCTG